MGGIEEKKEKGKARANTRAIRPRRGPPSKKILRNTGIRVLSTNRKGKSKLGKNRMTQAAAHRKKRPRGREQGPRRPSCS